jgi:MoaA/NifB/PqqE/SkfB family radical SAM enzyme
MTRIAVRRAIRKWNRIYREVRLIALALRSPRHPVFAHVVVTRRCNLSCTYCSEFDNFSKPVPTEEMIRRVDLLAALGTTAITLTGGETLLHPDLEKVIQHIRRRGLMVVLVTNGYLLSIERIHRLNRAGLDRMQISIDNVLPDQVSKKSLKVLDQKLQWLARYAEFPVHIHSVVGAGTDQPEDALKIAKRAAELGLGSSAGIVHDETGKIQPLSERARKVIDDIEKLSKPLFSFARHNPWRKNLLEGKPNNWHCPAGGRHLYICENGLVHYCMAQRGYPAIPLAEYTQEHIDRESKAPKACAPYCTIFCVHRVALLDNLRESPREALLQLFPASGSEGISDQGARPPLAIRALTSLLAPSRPSRSGQLFRKAALRLLKIS